MKWGIFEQNPISSFCFVCFRFYKNYPPEKKDFARICLFFRFFLVTLQGKSKNKVKSFIQ